LLLEVLELCWVEVGLLIFTLLLAFLSLLLLSQLLLEFSVLGLEVFSSLVSELGAPLHAPVVELVEPYDSSLVLLGEIVCNGGPATLFWADDDNVELVHFLNWSWVFHL